MKIRELEKEFVKGGVKYTQIEKNDVYVLYRCQCLEYADTYYEVFRPKLVPPHPYDTGGYDMVEAYPSNESFGCNSWCCSDIDSLKKVMKKQFDIGYKS